MCEVGGAALGSNLPHTMSVCISPEIPQASCTALRPVVDAATALPSVLCAAEYVEPPSEVGGGAAGWALLLQQPLHCRTGVYTRVTTHPILDYSCR